MLGLSLAFIVGFSLGLLGGGGSILTVPILVYILERDPKNSIAMSLAIVGATSVVGVINHWRAGNVRFKVALLFAPFAMSGTFLGARISQYLSSQFQLILFAIIMILASFFMIRGRKGLEGEEEEKSPPILIVGLQALIVGVMTGIVGVGGGFLLVPALTLLVGLPMHHAVGTSLLLIALNSFTGFAGYLGLVEIDWKFLGQFTGLSILGILAGSQLVPYIPQKKLKKGFGFFLIFMGIYVLYKNLS